MLNIIKKIQYLLILGAFPLSYLKYIGIVTFIQAHTDLNALNLIKLFVGILSIVFFGLLLFKIDVNKLDIQKLKIFFILNVMCCCFFLIIYDYRLYLNYYNKLQYKDFKYIWIIYVFDILFLILMFFAAEIKTLKQIFLMMAILQTIHSVISIMLFPYTYKSTDMLAAIHVAIENFFNGVSPYRQIYPYIGVMPYFPLTWLSFIPSYFMGLDFRLFTTFLTAISFYLIYKNYNKFSLLSSYIINSCTVFSIFIFVVYITSNHDLQQFYSSAFKLHLSGLHTYDGSDLTFGFEGLLFRHKTLLLTIQMIGMLMLLIFGLAKWIKDKHIYNYMPLAVFTYFIYISTSFYIMQYMYFPILIAIAITNIKSTVSIKIG